MNPLSGDIANTALIGIGATAVMDGWLLVLKRMHIPTLNFALVGRWVGHFRHGRFTHQPIAKAPPVQGEAAIGWLVHYASGMAFAALLVLLAGPDWIARPSLTPALLLGLGTVAVPFFVMQPAMGAGIASAKTPTPGKNRIRSLANHAVFGLGLYLAALFFAWIQS